MSVLKIYDARSWARKVPKRCLKTWQKFTDVRSIFILLQASGEEATLYCFLYTFR